MTGALFTASQMRVGSLKADGHKMYFLEHDPDSPNPIYEIPLHGGRIREVTEKAYWLDVNDGMVFYLSENFELIRMPEESSKEKKVVDRIKSISAGNAPFLCIDGHLMIADYNEKDKKLIHQLCYSDDEWRDEETFSTFIYDYIWADTEGNKKDMIKGVPISREALQRYKRLKRHL